MQIKIIQFQYTSGSSHSCNYLYSVRFLKTISDEVWRQRETTYFSHSGFLVSLLAVETGISKFQQCLKTTSFYYADAGMGLLLHLVNWFISHLSQNIVYVCKSLAQV